VNKESILPFDGIISTRQFLLKLRAKNNALQGKKIPLSEDTIRKRQSNNYCKLRKLANTLTYEQTAERVYNPLEGTFRYQTDETKKRIKEVLNKITNNRHVTNTGVVTASYKYRLVDEVVS
jgi:hypothetical protein